ncbi:N-acetyltransferase [Paenibacillus nanensis]|uniref:N-acetyltransferase n=1 Tax=Paenibacillus nanensis TaxID=393251 RepID=A0A3A1UMD3_9BACL|nr:GNAT family protein [Paenibacillus nanensis]RIX48629.1 N-acetyltransferase [Paenibacillus nanensis]
MAPVRFLEGKQVYLRPIEAADADWYFESVYRKETRRLTGTQKHFSREQIADYIAGKAKDTSSVLLLIAKSDNDELIGDIAIQGIDSINRNASIRVAINQDAHQGKGYGSEALLLMLDYGFGVLNLHRIELYVYSYNERAKHVYEKLGFVQEGVQRDALFYEHRYYDSIIMSMLEDEYRARYVKTNGE